MSVLTLLSVFIFLSLSSHAEELPNLADPIEIERDWQSAEEIKQAQKRIAEKFKNSAVPKTRDANWRAKYSHLDPYNEVPYDLMNEALTYFDRNQSNFENRDYITIVDYSARSNFQRFFVINMETGEVMKARFGHGSGGDKDNDGYVEKVSNIPNSHMSSKGMYYVAETYYGKYGRSIRLDGLSITNSKARSRAIVLHGADYVREKNVIQGRSWGCFTLAWSLKDDVVDKIAEGSLLYADYSKP